MIIFKLDVEGLASLPSPLVVIKELNQNLKTFEVKELEIEDITRKMRRIMVLEGVPPKKLHPKKVRVKFKVHHDLPDLKREFPNGKLLGQVELDSGTFLYVYRAEK